VDAERLRPLVETYLASSPGQRTGRDWIDLGMRRPDGADVQVRKGKDDKSSVFLAWYLPAENAERAAVVAEALSEYLDIVLVREIREKLGGVYAISSYVSLGAAPRGELTLMVNFSCDPGRAEELTAAVQGLLSGIGAGKVDADTFGKAVSALKRGREQSLQDNGFIASVLASLDVVHRRPLDRLYGYGENYGTLRQEELSDMAAALLSRERIRVALYPGK
jgi:zinc protease